MTPLLLNVLISLISFILGAAYGYRKATDRMNKSTGELKNTLEEVVARVQKALDEKTLDK